MINQQNIPLLAGVPLPQLTPFKLQSQHVPIQGVVVDNANSTVDVYVYQGVSPSGIPYIVKAGWSRGFSVNGTSAIYVVFSGTPSANGSIYISVSSEPQTAFSTQVASVTITNPISIAGVVPVSQSGTWNVGSITTLPAITIAAAQSINVGNFPATQAVSGTVTANQGSIYPSGSTNANQQTAAVSFVSPLTILSVTGISGHVLYIARIFIKGLSYQAIKWTISSTNFTTPSPLPAGIGDIDLHFLPALQVGSASGTPATLTLVSADTILGILLLSGFVQAYYI